MASKLGSLVLIRGGAFWNTCTTSSRAARSIALSAVAANETLTSPAESKDLFRCWGGTLLMLAADAASWQLPLQELRMTSYAEIADGRSSGSYLMQASMRSAISCGHSWGTLQHRQQQKAQYVNI